MITVKFSCRQKMKHSMLSFDEVIRRYGCQFRTGIGHLLEYSNSRNGRELHRLPRRIAIFL